MGIYSILIREQKLVSPIARHLFDEVSALSDARPYCHRQIKEAYNRMIRVVRAIKPAKVPRRHDLRDLVD